MSDGGLIFFAMSLKMLFKTEDLKVRSGARLADPDSVQS